MKQKINLKGLCKELKLNYLTVYWWVKLGKIKLPEDLQA